MRGALAQPRGHHSNWLARRTRCNWSSKGHEEVAERAATSSSQSRSVVPKRISAMDRQRAASVYGDLMLAGRSNHSPTPSSIASPQALVLLMLARGRRACLLGVCPSWKRHYKKVFKVVTVLDRPSLSLWGVYVYDSSSYTVAAAYCSHACLSTATIRWPPCTTTGSAAGIGHRAAR